MQDSYGRRDVNCTWEFSSGSGRGRYASVNDGYGYIPAYQQGQFVLVKWYKLPY